MPQKQILIDIVDSGNQLTVFKLPIFVKTSEEGVEHARRVAKLVGGRLVNSLTGVGNSYIRYVIEMKLWKAATLPRGRAMEIWISQVRKRAPVQIGVVALEPENHLLIKTASELRRIFYAEWVHICKDNGAAALPRAASLDGHLPGKRRHAVLIYLDYLPSLKN